jgi:4a-hydroxytetrahydrobiopterin dehydratase
MSDLAEQRCVPCRGGQSPLAGEALETLAAQVPGWRVVDGRRLVRLFRFPDFAAALDFTHAIGAIAEAEGHHPDLHLAWGKLEVELWTHDVGGLSESDFILAAKISRLAAARGLG